MTYLANELLGGQPIELYQFTFGTTRWNWTSGDDTVNYGGQDFTPTPIRRGPVAMGKEAAGAYTDVTLPRDNPVAQLFAAWNPSRPVSVTIWRQHRSDTEVIVAFPGEVATVVFEDAEAKLRCVSLQAVFKRSLPSVPIQRSCTHMLYDQNCGLDRALFKTSGTIANISTDGLTLTIVAAAGQADGYFARGFLAFGMREEFIVSHIGQSIVILAPIIGLALGNPVDLFAGCDRSHGDCWNKFGNILNHGGYPLFPTRNPFDGRLV